MTSLHYPNFGDLPIGCYFKVGESIGLKTNIHMVMWGPNQKPESIRSSRPSTFPLSARIEHLVMNRGPVSWEYWE